MRHCAPYVASNVGVRIWERPVRPYLGSAVSTYPAGTSKPPNFRNVGLTRKPPAVCGTARNVSFTTASVYFSWVNILVRVKEVGSADFKSLDEKTPLVF